MSIQILDGLIEVDTIMTNIDNDYMIIYVHAQ